ncbi:hypothetical protein E0H73_33940 [Kribbella pittospori]|uniref:Uncharacterized protein n=1 Tax=Kribbella pittospori TaxID=722689 RepID=A0A4R0KDK4_9ACTN|nr:hypothetical protein [Kribbella pittospori]TCC56158.1 hypothetical protein E0H73_33940 [Kribbella pittospori]
MSYPPGGPAAPNYGQPPRKNRAGLIITLLVALLVGVLITGGVLVARLISGRQTPTSAPTKVTSVAVNTPNPSIKLPTKTIPVPTGKPTTRPSTTQSPAPKPAATVAGVARRFVAQLNANNPNAATALACRSAKQVIPFLMQQYLKPPTRLAAGPTPIGQQITFVVQLSGTTKGSTVSGIVVIQQLAPEPICVRAFSVSPG